MKNRDIYCRGYKKHCTQDNDASVPFKVGTLGPHTVLPIAISCLFIFSWISSMVWNPFPFKGDLSFRKIQKSQGTKSGLLGVWVTWVIWCFATKHCKRHDAWVGALPWWSCQLPVAHNCGLLNHPNSFLGRMFKLNAKFDADSLLYLLSLNVTATQYTCSLSGIYQPHWLVQWSRHCSHMLILVHSLWLPGYITVSQTALILLTMTWFFPDRPRIYINQREDKIVYNQILNYLVK